MLPLWRVLLAASMMIAAVPARARLYQAGTDPVWVLEAATVRKVLRGSPSAWLVQFYSSACGHCVAFAPTWKALAGDVRGERAKRTGAPNRLGRAPPLPHYSLCLIYYAFIFSPLASWGVGGGVCI